MPARCGVSTGRRTRVRFAGGLTGVAGVGGLGAVVGREEVTAFAGCERALFSEIVMGGSVAATATGCSGWGDVGFGVSAISALLASRGTPAWTGALNLQRDTLADDLRAASGRLTLITRLLDQGEPDMSITLDRTVVPAMTVVALRGTVPTYSDEGLLWGRLMPALGEQRITPVGPCGVIEHDEEYTEHDVDLSIYLPVAEGTTAAAPLEILDLPQRDCLVARVVGSYDQISAAHDLINQRVAAEDLALRADGSLAAKAFNQYLTTPDKVSEDELITLVCQPLA